MIQINLLTKQKETHRFREQTYSCQGEGLGGKDSYGVWDGHGHTVIFKRAETYPIAHGTLLNVIWQPGWEGSLEEMNACIYVTESLCCSPEAITTLLISYCSVIQSYRALCDSMNCSVPDSSVLHHLLELAQTHVH